MRKVPTYCLVKNHKVWFVDISARITGHIFAIDGHFVIRRIVRIFVQIEVHADSCFVPNERVEMKVVLQTVWICGSTCIIGIRTIVPAFAPVTGTVEISFLSAVFDTVGIFL